MTEQSKPGAANGTIGAYELRRATEAAARAAYAWIGRGDKALADDAAVSAMDAELQSLNLDGLMLMGEGPRDEIGMLYHGQRFGTGTAAPAWDLVVDPLEGTSFLAKGMTNAMAVVAMAPHGTLFDPSPARYMEKLAAPPAARGRIDPEAPVAERLKQLSLALNKPLEDMTVYVIEKARHKALVQAIHNAGARVALYPAGDVAGALMAAMGGEFLGRIDPQLATEAAAIQMAGMDLSRWYRLDEMVRSDDVVFCATGITTGLLLDGVERTRELEKTQTLMIGGAAGPRQMLTSWHRRA
jgi:fructose-1,6-bisphosphatase II